MIGQSVSHYHIVGKLGEGGMGAVYEARDLQLQRDVALKFLPSELADDPQARRRLVQEARAASRLNHPNIATIYEVGEDKGTSFIVMERVHGENLKQMLARGAVEPARLFELAEQVTEGLREAHQAGVLHRDIKPGNIMVDHKGRVKILDFGLAIFSARERSPEETMETYISRTATQWSTGGTVPYMSPEQLRGEPTDARSDIFSLGVLLYECLTGRLPFRGETSIDTLHAILHHPLTPVRRLVPQVSAEWEQVLERCLAKSPEQRYRSMAEVIEALRQVGAPEAGPEKSIAVLYFENLSGVKEDEYFRDGMTEDIITELANIRGLKVFPRAAVVGYRDKLVTGPQVGHELNAAHVLVGSLRRAGNRLRITAQLLETRSGHTIWAQRYDRELKDVFEVQDEIARNIAHALRVTLSPQEERAIAHKPTANTQAYDYYLRGRNYTRRISGENLDFALQMFEHAIALDPGFALAYAGIANACGQIYDWKERDERWIDRGLAACDRALVLEPRLAEALAARARICYSQHKYKEAIEYAQQAIERKWNCEGAYWALGQGLFVTDRWGEAAALTERAIEANGDDYNVYIPYTLVLERLGEMDRAKRLRQQQVHVLEQHLDLVPEDVRARILLATNYVSEGQENNALEHLRMSVSLRPREPLILYNAACVYGLLQRKAEALEMLRRAKEVGWTNFDWAARDPDLACLKDDPGFQAFIAEGKNPT